MVSWPAVVSSEAPSAWLPVTGRATNAKAANRGIAQDIATGSKSLSGRLGFIVHPFQLTTDKADEPVEEGDGLAPLLDPTLELGECQPDDRHLFVGRARRRG